MKKFPGQPSRLRRAAESAACSKTPIVCAFVLAGALLAACSSTPDPLEYRRDDPSEYYLYLPSGYSNEQKWPIFVGVHGFGGSGRDCWSMWQAYADSEGFVLICPSLADENGGWRQDTGEATLNKILNRVFKDYSVQNKIFLTGFSAGAQFVQGYAFRYPDVVTGVSVMSSGNYYVPVSTSSGVPFLVIIGDQDDPVSVEGAKEFAAGLQGQGYSVDLLVLSGVGHEAAQEGKERTIELFRRVTGK